ncbi:hypothetical protein B8V81_1104 [Paenibacillus pasadenensis]|uniref:Uncharacterized protein n=1 Tax=Paenibacillus pasadenensis TaxID=217090 RepID=A0A2N5N9C3_9BACL|nr:hypothetical protein B8V81_1104 [Paenibacillus pasadenensis]
MWSALIPCPESEKYGLMSLLLESISWISVSGAGAHGWKCPTRKF